MKDKQRCIARAREMGVENEIGLGGCAHGAFVTILDALREEGYEFITPEQEDEVLKSLVALTGGFGNSNEGTCGAVVGSGAAISLIVGCSRAEQANDGGENTRRVAYAVKTAVVEPFVKKYGSIICRDLLYNVRNMSFCSQYPGRSKEFASSTLKCECRHPERCVISNASAWALDFLWDYLEGKTDISQAWDQFAPKDGQE